ncbi:hypothetical protein KR50_08130 [Jeotgalibacillus campisalis]|uniref:Uncharacterized protein n=1 Tax=Jeotgalibacillus campisalis TaxID=220754 RepID=A0A0C2VPU2_9BACL|nr:hypothetical protein KR50_08130 [Jeotgalibacillus campisalis]
MRVTDGCTNVVKSIKNRLNKPVFLSAETPLFLMHDRLNNGFRVGP